MPTSPTEHKPLQEGQDALKAFQLTTEGISNKSSREYGLELSKKIFGTANSGAGGYYFARNARIIKNRNYANGRIDVQAMFQDRFEMNGKQNYIFLNFRTLQLCNRIISGLVGRWMMKGEKIQVQAIDSLSVKQKQDEYESIEFILENRAKLEQLSKESGVQLIPQDQFLPADREELNLWQQQFQRLPEEICYELGINDCLGANGWYSVLKEKMLHDAAEAGLVGTYVWMDENGVIHVEWVKPENAIYSATEYPDFRDTTWRGQIRTRKISEIRRMFGKEFNPNNPFALDEQELWKIAQQAKEYKSYSSIVWQDMWYATYMRPYDEWNVRSMEYELKTVDSEPYTITKSKKTETTYIQKGYPVTPSGKKRAKPADNQEVRIDSNWNIYQGVYLPDSDKLLKWGLKDNMIRPQDPTEIGNAEFSYSFYMYQPYEMRNMAIPEKIEAAIDGMILALLKIQQVVSRMRPTGAAIDTDALQAIDYGLADKSAEPVDPKKLYDQTGDIYYRGRDAEGNKIPIPIQELQNSGFLGQMQGLIQDYQFWYQTLKDELGEDPNLISAALQPRVTGQNVEASQTQAEYATDYIYRAYAECMKQTGKKISCLLKDSVQYGAKAYRAILKQEDVGDRIFSTDIRFLPTQFEVQRFEAILNTQITATPDLVMFLDPFQLMRIAKEDAKLAEALFRQGQRKMLNHQIMMQQQNQQMTIQGQIDAAKTAEEEKRITKELELDIEKQKTEITGQAQNRTALLNGALALLKTSGENGAAGSIPPNIMPFVNAVLENVGLAAMLDTQEQKDKVLGEMKAAAEQQQMQQQNINQQQQPQVAA